MGILSIKVRLLTSLANIALALTVSGATLTANTVGHDAGASLRCSTQTVAVPAVSAARLPAEAVIWRDPGRVNVSIRRVQVDVGVLALRVDPDALDRQSRIPCSSGVPFSSAALSTPPARAPPASF